MEISVRATITSRAAPLLAAILSISAMAPCLAQENESLFGVRSASVTYGPYVRLEFGSAMPSLSDAYWLPPGQADPRIDFSASGSDAGIGAVAFGFDWQTGIRGDLSFFGMRTSDIVAPCSGASDGSECAIHADIKNASVTTKGAMANVFYAPFEARGSNSIFQPFIVAGLGIARNEVGAWTRENSNPPPPDKPDRRELRTFEGDSSAELAWSIGVGASLQVTRQGKWPVMIEAAWRYYDFGSATGSATPFPENGNSQPRQPFTFDNEAHVITLGVRIPLQRY
jgi:opacity protein-like surface antigen